MGKTMLPSQWFARAACSAAVMIAGLAIPQPARACMCLGTQSVCRAYANAELVFSGRVEGIQPRIDERDPAVHRRLLQLFSAEELDNLDHSDSPDVIRRVKQF